MINITVDFKDGDKFNQFIRYIENNLIYGEAQEAMVELGENTAENMRETIDNSRTQPDKGTHKLETAIDSKILNTTGGILIGVGEIAKLRAEAPYFEVLDVGGYVPPANRGFFPGNTAPQGGKSGELWTHTGNRKDFLMRPKKAIEGIDYIGKAIRNLDKELKKKIEEFGGKLINGMKQ